MTSLTKENAEALRAEGYRYVLVYSIADNVRLLRRALAGGADGAAVKPIPSPTRWRPSSPSPHGREVIQPGRSWPRSRAMRAMWLPRWGRGEREVLSLYAAGLEIRRSGRTLYITENSVKEYLKRIRAKYTQVDRPAASKLELFRRAVEDSIVPRSSRASDPAGVHRRRRKSGSSSGAIRTPESTTASASRGTPHDEPAQRSDPGQEHDRHDPQPARHQPDAISVGLDRLNQGVEDHGDHSDHEGRGA